MSYEMEYAMGHIRRKRLVPGKRFIQACFLVVILTVGTFGSVVASGWIAILMIKPKEMKSATETLIAQLHSGQSVDEAVQTFCAELSE